MPKKTTDKIRGLVFLKEIAPGRWRADWRDPITRRRSRVQLPATTYREAKAEATKIANQVAHAKGFHGRMRGGAGHLIENAVREAVLHTGASEQTRADYLRRANPFAEYLEQYAPGLRAWGDLNEAVIENYVEHCRRQELPHDTLRLRIYTLRLTSRYMARTYHYRDILAGVRLRRREPTQAELEAKETVLSPAALRRLLAYLREHEPMVHVWAVLQGLAGLRMLEAAYLTESDFDAEAGTLRITANEAHRPKTRHSYRVIPLCPEVQAALAAWIGGLKVRHEAGFLFFPSKSPGDRRKAKSPAVRAGAFGEITISHRWRRAMQGARKALDVPEAFTPRKLRASFITALREAGADMGVLQKYVGHAPTTIMARHYDEIGMERLEAVAGLAQDLFEAKRAFKPKAKKPGKNATFGH